MENKWLKVYGEKSLCLIFSIVSLKNLLNSKKKKEKENWNLMKKGKRNK